MMNINIIVLFSSILTHEFVFNKLRSIVMEFFFKL